MARKEWHQLMAMIEKVDRVALLSDDALIRTAARVESAVIPNLVIRNFDPDDEAGEAMRQAPEPVLVDGD